MIGRLKQKKQSFTLKATQRMKGKKKKNYRKVELWLFIHANQWRYRPRSIS